MHVFYAVALSTHDRPTDGGENLGGALRGVISTITIPQKTNAVLPGTCLHVVRTWWYRIKRTKG